MQDKHQDMQENQNDLTKFIELQKKKEEARNVLSSYLQDAIAYLRYSTHMQDGGVSIEYQMREIEEYAKKNGFQITKWYIDKATSASKVAGRDEFMKMVREIESKQTPGNLIVFATARVFRDAIDSSLYREKFRKNGVKLHSVTQTIDDETTNGRLITDLMARIDQFKIEEIGEYVSAATKLLITEGFSAGGPAPFGYQASKVLFNGNERVKFIPYEPEAEIVRYVFDSFVSGRQFHPIAKSLFKKGITKRSGKPFEAEDIRKMLHNPVYKGERFYKMKSGEIVHAPNYCEALVSKEQFDKAQEIFSANKETPIGRKRNRIYPLTGKLVCGKCGRPMGGHTSPAHQYYACSSKHTTADFCGLKSVRKDWIDKAAFNVVKDNLLTPEAVDKIADAIMQQIKKTPAVTEDKKELMKRKKELEIEIAELVQMKVKKDITESVYQISKQPFENELHTIERKLSQINAANDSRMNENYIRETISAVFDTEQSFASIDSLAVKDLFDQTIDKVVADDTQVEFHLRVPLDQSLFNFESEFPLSFLNIKIKRPFGKGGKHKEEPEE